MLDDSLKMVGNLIIVKTDSVGRTEEYAYPNLVVSAGKDYIAARMSANTVNVMRAIAIGSGTAAPALGNTTLATEITRVATTVTGGTATANSILYTATFPAGTGTGTIAEAGIFNNTIALGTMLCRTSFSSITKGAGDSITINWTVNVL